MANKSIVNTINVTVGNNNKNPIHTIKPNKQNKIIII